jgi:CPA2 family monovalent cation:H+ antiporter-2
MTQFFFHKDRENLRALASLWQPGVPVSQNKAYVDRARELNAELETALVEHMGAAEAEKARA